MILQFLQAMLWQLTISYCLVQVIEIMLRRRYAALCDLWKKPLPLLCTCSMRSMDTSVPDVFILPDTPFGDSTQTLVTATAKISEPIKDNQIVAEVQVKIAAGWHINANPAGQDNLIPTTIAVAEDAPVEVSEVKYPKGKSVHFEFSPEPINVYEKTFTIPVKLKQKPEMTINKDTPIILKLDYQPCNETKCSFPATLDVPLKLQ